MVAPNPHPTRPGHRALRRGRSSLPGYVYHLTTATAERQPWFATFAAAQAVARCVAAPTGAHTLAWCLMPDHLHWLMQLAETLPLTRVVQRFKSLSAIAVNHALGRSGAVWAGAYHDHQLRQEEDLRIVARYIVANPLRAGLVTRLGDYPYWDATWLDSPDADSLLL